VLVSDAFPGILGPTHTTQIVAITRWIPHPQYDPATSDNDIALIQLSVDATLAPPRFDDVPLYTPETIPLGSTPTASGAGVGAVGVVGFGRIDSPQLPTVDFSNPGYAFYATGLPSRPIGDCSFLGGALSSTRQLCYAGYPNACFGDSGGPVFKFTANGFVQLGVVSRGPVPCGTGPSVATYVPGYLAWINQEIGDTPASSPIQFGWELPPSSENGVATGVSNAQGWAFSSAGTITSVRLERNGQHFLTLPCCSERGDVKGAIPSAPLLSGFSAAVSWGALGDATSNLTLVIRDSAGNERRETRTIRSVQILGGVPFVGGLAFAQSSFCELFNQGGRGLFTCAGLVFPQGTCNGDVTFAWQNGKQSFEVVSGCQ